MRIPKFSYLFISALLLSASCSKDSETDSDSENAQGGTDTENPETGKPETGNADKAKAQQLYADYYMASQNTESDISWTGSVPDCQAGTVPQETMDKIFLRLSYFRKAVGLNNNVVNNTTKSEKAQKAALMMHANGTLDHFPPDNWNCFTADGKEGAGNSLLTSTKNAAAIDSYIRDQGSENYPVGHRRWLLWPRLQEIGVGNTSSYNAVWVLGNPGSRPADTPEFIAWPPQGYLPKQLAYPRWSFSIDKAEFEDTKISMRVKDGANIPVEIEELTGIYGDNTIVWRPDVNINTLTEDTTYIVSLSDVSIDGNATDFEYEVSLFDVNQ
ncbi:MAG: CAP domain-containing protein [Pricia sp.]